MPHNENSRVKIPALVHFTRLGYKYISLRKYEGVIDDDTNILVDVLCDDTTFLLMKLVHIISGHLSRSVAAIPSTYGQMSVYLPAIIVCSKERFRSSILSMVSRLAKKSSGQICGKSQKENTVPIF